MPYGMKEFNMEIYDEKWTLNTTLRNKTIAASTIQFIENTPTDALLAKFVIKGVPGIIHAWRHEAELLRKEYEPGATIDVTLGMRESCHSYKGKVDRKFWFVVCHRRLNINRKLKCNELPILDNPYLKRAMLCAEKLIASKKDRSAIHRFAMVKKLAKTVEEFERQYAKTIEYFGDADIKAKTDPHTCPKLAAMAADIRQMKSNMTLMLQPYSNI
jgi:hypothetical protein